MYAILVTKENLEIVKTMDPELDASPQPESILGNYVVFDKHNDARYVVESTRFEEFFSIERTYAVNLLKVSRK